VRKLQELNENVEKLQNDMEDRTILESIQDFKEYAPRSNANLGY
jgi:outer membrane murein-binding lipoprotein Lpp